MCQYVNTFDFLVVVEILTVSLDYMLMVRILKACKLLLNQIVKIPSTTRNQLCCSCMLLAIYQSFLVCVLHNLNLPLITRTAYFSFGISINIDFLVASIWLDVD